MPRIGITADKAAAIGSKELPVIRSHRGALRISNRPTHPERGLFGRHCQGHSLLRINLPRKIELKLGILFRDEMVLRQACAGILCCIAGNIEGLSDCIPQGLIREIRSCGVTTL